MSAIKICCDAGHGGNDTGAVGPTGLEEAAVVLDICYFLCRRFWDLPISYLLTRETDVYVSLEQRCKLANDWGADYFISVHCNSDGPSAEGIETLYKSPKGKELALPMHESLIKATGDIDRGLKHRDDLYVLNGTDMPAILAEVGFISHAATESNFKTAEYRNMVAGAIASGLMHFLNLPPPSVRSLA